MVLFGGVIIRVVVDGAHVNYVKASMGPWLLLSGVVLLILGALAVVDVIREDDPTGAPATDVGSHVPVDSAGSPVPRSGDPGDPAAAEGHGSHGPRTAWALLLPVAAVLLVPAAPLGSFTATRIDAFTPVAASDALYPPIQGDPADLEMADFVSRAVWDDGRTLADRRVRLVGFVSPDGDGSWYLTRLGLSCCAADAYALKVHPLGAPDFPADTWAQVTGTWTPGGGTQEPGAIPQIQVDTAVPTPAPANPYES